MKKTIIGLSIVFFLTGQTVLSQKPVERSAPNTQFSEMTTLDQFGGPSLGKYNPTQAEEQRIEWFREAKFGLFIHWGLYSKMAGYWKDEKVEGGEWAIKMNKLPIEEYRELAKEFNPVKFNAEEWVLLAKAAGMKYIVITAKHHDGFAMFKSNVSSYNIVDATPFRRDPIKELKEACDKHGIKLGLYYSHAQDWNEPDAYGNNWSFGDYKGDMDAYLENKALPQIREICQQYQPDIVWYDTPGDMTLERAQKVANLTRSILPDVLINSRIFFGNHTGLWDYQSGGDNEGFPQYNRVPWELCGTMNRSWAFKKWDTNFRPVSELLYHLIDAVSKNGNYLLNVGPTSEGEISEPYALSLHQIGEWLKINGEAIYGCGGTAFGTEFGDYAMGDGKKKFEAAPVNWRCTTKPGKVYIHVINWPEDGKLELPALKDKIKMANLLANPKTKIKVNQTADRIVLTLPENAPNSIIPVVRLSL
jgi:alpha-L-fucosidase